MKSRRVKKFQSTYLIIFTDFELAQSTYECFREFVFQMLIYCFYHFSHNIFLTYGNQWIDKRRAVCFSLFTWVQWRAHNLAKEGAKYEGAGREVGGCGRGPLGLFYYAGGRGCDEFYNILHADSFIEQSGRRKIRIYWRFKKEDLQMTMSRAATVVGEDRVQWGLLDK